jgi:hypothetical protein
MSWSDQNIDDLARESSANLKFTYDPSFWKEAETMLPPKGRTFPFWILNMLVAGVVLAVALPVTWNHFAYDESAIASNQGLTLRKNRHYSSIISTSEGGQDELPDKFEGLTQDPLVDLNKKEAVSKNEISLKEVNSLPKQDQKRNHSQLLDQTKTVRAEFAQIDKISPIKFEQYKWEQGEIGSHIIDFPVKQSKLNAYYLLGGSVGQNPIKTIDRITKTLNIGGGIMYSNRSWKIILGAEFSYQALNLQLAEKSTNYDYELNDFSHFLNYKEFYRLDIPLILEKGFGKSNIQMGVSANVMLSSKMRYNLIQNGELKRNVVLYGESKGVSNFGMTSLLGYNYSLNRQWTVGANVQWQLITQVSREMVDNDVIRPFSAQLYIRKSIIKK